MSRRPATQRGPRTPRRLRSREDNGNEIKGQPDCGRSAGKLQDEPGREKETGSDHQPFAPQRRLRRPWLFVLEPGTHARLSDGLCNSRGGELGGVVLNAQALADDVGVEGLEPGQSLEAMLEDRHFFVAVHALDLEDRLSVQFANGALGHLGSLLDVGERLPEQFDDVLIVNRVVHEAAGAPRPDQPHTPQEAQLVGYGRLADAHERRDVAHAQLAARQRVKNAHPCRITEDAKRFGQRRDCLGRHQALTPGLVRSDVRRRTTNVDRHNSCRV